ncbi:MAG: glutamyl-Q tRNA(Asp) synthetase [Methylobacteriaceae bacterium]|jgi:glutamyl-Q tRNA(Asp) synthetase|nr:glutamyl-Q tRNA(Asp) synthetase [Methylobacteriaceae bacterium]
MQLLTDPRWQVEPKVPAPLLFRFAPSPNGYLHLGHAYSALLNANMARESCGRLLLRIEDIDIARCRPEYERAIYEDLAWIGFKWEGPVRRQSEHLADYGQALGSLRERGVIYPCFCTRGEISRAIAGRPDWPRDPDGSPLYPGTCRHLNAAERAARLALHERAAWRLDMEKAIALVGPLTWSEYDHENPVREIATDPWAWGDVVLARRDIATSYHLSVILDDAQQSITDIVRGKDLFASTSVHRLLQVLLGLPAPRYHHHALITDANGHKLSKSRGSPTLRDLRTGGMTRDQISRAVGL